MVFRKWLGKRLGPSIPLRRKLRRMLKRKRPKGMSLKQWRKTKPKKPMPSLGKNQRPLQTISEARRQIAAVKSLGLSGREKFVAYTNLLSRAFAGKRNPAVIKLIGAERDRIRISWAKKEPSEKKLMPEKKPLLGNALKQTNVYFETLASQLGKGNFKGCNALIRVLATDTPQIYAGTVAARLESIGTQQELKLIKQKSKDPAFIQTVAVLYSAAGELYRLRGMPDQAEEMFNEATDFLARAKHGF